MCGKTAKVPNNFVSRLIKMQIAFHHFSYAKAYIISGVCKWVNKFKKPRSSCSKLPLFRGMFYLYISHTERRLLRRNKTNRPKKYTESSTSYVWTARMYIQGQHWSWIDTAAHWIWKFWNNKNYPTLTQYLTIWTITDYFDD